MPEVDKLALLRMADGADFDVFWWLAKTPMQELRFSTLYVVGWMSEIPNEGLRALYDMIARRNPPGTDVRNPSPKEVSISVPDGEGVPKNLKSLCRDKGILFGLISEMSTLP